MQIVGDNTNNDGDMLLNRNLKEKLMLDGRIQDHHSFKNTGWISFYIHTKNDADYALELLQLGYLKIVERNLKFV